MKTFKIDSESNGTAQTLSLRCPACRRDGSFEPLPTQADFVTNSGRVWLGQRRCPNLQCRTHVFVAWSPPSQVLASYPAERIDFDSSNIPPQVVASFEEGLTCHAEQCYTGAAMLVRKTLEQLCDDRGATGPNLKERLQSLRSKVILPDALFGALDSLRLLGNDAAHIEAKTYNDVGENEVRVAIALTKEILKAVYQYDALVGQLNALKRP